MNGLDLFSGIGGLSLALAPWVKPVAYCENDRYAQAVLLSRMRDGHLALAPIWDDVSTLRGDMFGHQVDIIYGGFPCQDISVAGRGKGLEGKRSGLFFEIARLVQELEPALVFLENVPAIRSRGLARVCFELAQLGYDLRWTTVSAAEVGAPHLRKRWFCLAAHAERIKLRVKQQRMSGGQSLGIPDQRKAEPQHDGGEKYLANVEGIRGEPGARGDWQSERKPAHPFPKDWWAVEPDVGRVAHGIPLRVDRLHGLGNAVVPAQAREAFERLSGLKQ